MDLNKEVLKGHIDTLILSILNKGIHMVMK